MKKALLALSTVSLLACGGSTGGAGSDAMKFIPENSKGVMVIDVKKAIASPVMSDDRVKTEIAKMKEDKGYKEMVAAGLDPWTNLNVVVLAGDPAKKYGAAILSGTFDAAKVADAMKKKMAEEKDDTTACEVLGANMLAVGSKEAVASAKAGKGLDGSPDVKGMLSLADNSKMIFAVGVIPAEILKDMPLPQLANLKGAGFSLDFSSGFDMKALARFAAEADATGIKGMIDGFLPMAKGQVPDDIMAALKIEAKGADLSVGLTLNADQLKKLEAMAPPAGAAGPEPMPMPTPAPGMDPAAPGAASAPAAP